MGLEVRAAGMMVCFQDPVIHVGIKDLTAEKPWLRPVGGAGSGEGMKSKE